MARFKFKKRSAESAQRRLAGDARDPFLKPGIKFFKPAEGINSIRIMPPTWDDAEHYGVDIHVHYQVGPDNAQYLCLQRMKISECPICEERARAMDAGDEEYAKTLYPTKRVLTYIVDTKAPKDGVKAWPMPYKNIDQKIVFQSTDQDSGEYFAVDDIDEGFNVSIEKTGKGLQTTYGVSIARHSTAFKMTDEVYEFLTENPLPDILQFYDYDHIAQAFGKKTSTSSSAKQKKEKTTEAPKTWRAICKLTSDELDLVVTEHTDLDAGIMTNDDEVRSALAEELDIQQPEKAVEETPDEKESKTSDEDEDEQEDEDEDEEPKTSGKPSFRDKMKKMKANRGS